MTWYDWLSTGVSAWFLAASGTGILLGQLIKKTAANYPKAVPIRTAPNARALTQPARSTHIPH